MRSLLAILAVALVSSPAEAALVLSACGQTVAAGAELAGNFDCTGFPTAAVVVESGTVDLKGFTLTAGEAEGILCNGSCTVTSTVGVGTVQGAGTYGIYANGPTLSVSNVHVSGSGGSGIVGSSMDVADVTASGNAGAGISCIGGNMRVQNSTVTNNGGGISGGDGKNNLINVDVTGNTYSGFTGLGLEASDSNFSGNLVGIRQIFFNPCGPSPGDGPCPKRIRLSNCTVNDNVQLGIDTIAGVYLLDSTVSGNGDGGVFDEGHWIKYLPDRPQTYPCSSSSVVRSTVSNNGGFGIFSGSRTIKIDESDVSGNSGNGIEGHSYCARRLKVTESTVNGNGLHGILGTMEERATVGVRDSAVTGNGTDPACGVSQTCADVASDFAPRLRDTTCATSYASLSGFPGTSWTVCSSD